MATADQILAQAAADAADARLLATDATTQAGQSVSEAKQIVAGLHIATRGGAGVPEVVSTTPKDAPQSPTDFTTEIKDAFDYAFNSFNDTLRPQIVNYLDTFFPDISAALKSGSDQWLVDTIANGRFVPADVEAAIWNRAKDREVAEASRAEQDIIDASAARGFPTPSGIVNATVSATREELTKKLTSINREMAIKAFDVANENTKFAIQQAVQLRVSFVSAMGDFIKTAMHQPNNAVEYAKTVLGARSTLYDAALKLYSTQIDEEKLRTSVALELNSQNLRRDEINTKETLDYWDARTKNATVQANVAIAAADHLAKVAAAALATRNSVISMGGAV